MDAVGLYDFSALSPAFLGGVEFRSGCGEPSDLYTVAVSPQPLSYSSIAMGR